MAQSRELKARVRWNNFAHRSKDDERREWREGDGGGGKTGGEQRRGRGLSGIVDINAAQWKRERCKLKGGQRELELWH